MAYTGLGLTLSAGGSVGTQPPPKKPPGGKCVSEKVQKAAKLACRSFGLACAQAYAPICAPALHTTPLTIGPPPPPPKQMVPRTEDRPTFVSRTATAPTANLPVPPAAPAPIVAPPPLPPESPGIPIWVWIAGGAAVLGTGAFLYSRRKGS